MLEASLDGFAGRWFGEPPGPPVRGCVVDFTFTIDTALMARTQQWQPPTSILRMEAGFCPHYRLPQARAS